MTDPLDTYNDAERNREAADEGLGVEFDPSTLSIAEKLEAAGWYAVAEDVRDGVPLEVIESRIRKLGIPADEAAEPLAIIAEGLDG
jgi:hypothetical protein